MKRGMLAAAVAALLVLVPLSAWAEDDPPAPPADPPSTILPPPPSDPYVPPPPAPPGGGFTPPPAPDPVVNVIPPGTVIPWTGMPSTSYGCHYATPDAPCMQVPTGTPSLTDAQIRALVAASNTYGTVDVQFGADGSLQLRPAGSAGGWTVVGGKAGLAPFPPGTVKVMHDPSILKVLMLDEPKRLEP